MATKKAATSTKKSPSRAKSTKGKTTKKTVKSAPVTATRNTFVGSIQASARSLNLWRALGAELIGAFLLKSVFVAGQGQPIFVLFALVGIVLMIGAISGAHVNPAVTVGAWVTRRIGWLRAIAYIIVQCLGAALAFITLNAFIGGAATDESDLLFSAAPTLYQAVDVATLTGKEWYIFFAELLGTGILAFAVANATREAQERTAAAFTAGLGIFIALMIAVSSASYIGATAILNPAIAIALQGYGEVWSYAIYAIAPVIGGALGFIIYDLVRGRQMVAKK